MFSEKSFVLASMMLAVLVPSINALRTPVKRQSGQAFVSPLDGGGTMLTDTGNGLGEPLNVIISGLSSPEVLTDDGFLNYARSLTFDEECLGIHLGDPQSANLGDGNGPQNQTIELRENFDLGGVGSCFESLVGGNHLRLFRQNGPSADTGALFLAVAVEEDVSEGHTISPDGYDLGRDFLVGNATASTTENNGVTYSATVEDVTGLLPTGTAGINHDIAIDGIAKLLTVTIV